MDKVVGEIFGEILWVKLLEAQWETMLAIQ